MHLSMRETITKPRRSSPYRLRRYPVRPNFRHPTLPFILHRHQLVIPALLTTYRSKSHQLSYRGRIVTRNIISQRLSQNNQQSTIRDRPTSQLHSILAFCIDLLRGQLQQTDMYDGIQTRFSTLEDAQPVASKSCNTLSLSFSQ